MKMEDSTDYGPDGPLKIDGAYDYATSAHKELLIKEQTAGLVRLLHLHACDVATGSGFNR